MQLVSARRLSAVFLLAALPGSCAFAQTGGSVSLVSEYRFRGESLSNGNPEPQIAFSYDHPSGIYAGAFASKVDFEETGSDTQANVYAGYAGRLNSRTSWEAGVTQSTFVHTSEWNYQEIYAGLMFDHVEGRIYFSPNYYGQDLRTMYVEINGSYPLTEQWRLVGHIGSLSNNSSRQGAPGARQDYRAGINTKLFEWNLQLEWVGFHEKKNPYSIYKSPPSSAVVLTASYSF